MRPSIAQVLFANDSLEISWNGYDVMVRADPVSFLSQADATRMCRAVLLITDYGEMGEESV